MPVFSHRAYFRKFRLNPEQYGEILVAEAFHGQKMGDAEPGYDVLVSVSDFTAALNEIGVNFPEMLSVQSDSVRIEVKSKLAITNSRPEDEEGEIAGAWLMRIETAQRLRLKKGKTQYVNVNDLKNEPANLVVNIQSMLANVAEYQLV